MRLIATVFALMVVMTVALFLFVYSGAYNVAATEPHTAFTGWLLHTTLQQSVRRRATGIEAPVLEDPNRIETGLHHFREMCETCHGAPGVRPSEIGRGLNPEAPDLAEAAQHWTPAELFWIVKHGIKMTGMPAWGPTHSDDDLWGIVAFLKRLPRLSAEEYQTQAAGEGGHGHGNQGHGH
jgi:mono/diheme cytochrome c family protein